MGQSLPFLPVALSWLEPLVPVPMLLMLQPLREVVGLPQAGQTQSVPLAGSPSSAGCAPGSPGDSTSGNLGSSPIRRYILVSPLVVLHRPFASTMAALLLERLVAVLLGPQPVQDCCLLAMGPLPSSLLDSEHDNLHHRRRHLRRHHLCLVVHCSPRRFACRS